MMFVPNLNVLTVKLIFLSDLLPLQNILGTIPLENFELIHLFYIFKVKFGGKMGSVSKNFLTEVEKQLQPY